MIHVLYHGYVDIEYWEYTLSFFYLFLLYLYFARKKNMLMSTAPEYKYFVWGLFAKIFGGVLFSLIYFYYYKGGDTISYFYSAVSMSKLAKMDFLGFLNVLFGDNDYQHRMFFNEETGYPFGYVYFDPRTFFVIRFISPLVILALDSYLITTIILSSLSYIGVWKLFRMFVSYYPSLMGKFALAFLFMPSVIFWGSAILKDTFTFSAACWWIYFANEIYFTKQNRIVSAVGLVLSAVFMVIVKPYIFMVLFPFTVLWVFHSRIAEMKNTLLKFIFMPVAVIALFIGSYDVLSRLGGYLDKFSLDKALITIQTTQGDMSRAEQYGANYFDIGEFEATWSGIMSKFPIAVNAALFRPYIWESGSLVMALSALENLFLLTLVLYVAIRTRLFFLLRCYFGNPLLIFSLSFAIVFAFVIGISTPNFGALVRFKIPLVPLLVSSMYIVDLLYDRYKWSKRRGLQFELRTYQAGDPSPFGRVKKDLKAGHG